MIASVPRAQARAATLRAEYAARLPLLLGAPLRSPRELDLHVVAFSGGEQLPEQVASIRSLIRNVGRPSSLLIVSDGTHSDRERQLLHGVDRRVQVVDWDELAPHPLPPHVVRYAHAQPMGKKLAIELALPLDGPTLYVDADVLFFTRARELERAARDAESARYLRDCGHYLDERLLRAGEKRLPPVNGGVVLLHRRLDFSDGLTRLAALADPPVFHSEQTLLHLALHAEGAASFDPDRYVVSIADEQRLEDDYARPPTVLRHYTTPVRHKLWSAIERDPKR